MEKHEEQLGEMGLRLGYWKNEAERLQSLIDYLCDELAVTIESVQSRKRQERSKKDG